MDLLEKTAAAITKHQMLSGGETVLIGLSGGPDSVCLTTLLKGLAPRFELTLHALYIDHGLRPSETPQEAEFCREFCRSRGIPCEVSSLGVKPYAEEHGLNLQEAGRTLRYRELERLAFEIKADCIALGHNLDDQAETFLMRILRGTGRRGLMGIPPVRRAIIRPLIEIARKDIEAFLENEGIPFVTDSSNLDGHYLRNRIRASLMPLLKEMNPNILSTISQTTEIFREEEKYLETAVTKTLMRLITRKTDSAIELFLVPLEGMEKVLLRRVLRRAVEETSGLRGMGLVHIEDIIRLLKSGRPGDRIDLPQDIRAIKKYSTLLITSESPARVATYTLEAEGEAAIKEARVLIRASITEEAPPETPGQKTLAVFDAEKVSFPLTIRARREGDFFYPLGFGRRKKLQDFLVNEKVPRDERDAVPLVTSGGEIVWVAGMRGDERFRVSEGTRRFLLLELKGAG